MEREEGERFNGNPWEPHPSPHAGGFQRNAGNQHQNGGELHHRRNNGTPPDGSFGRGRGSFDRPQFSRKRNFSNSDCPDGSDFAKLFVGGIAITTAEEDIRKVFEKHGDIIEVVMVQNKKTSKQHEYCFVKYFSTQEADRAIAALHNKFKFPGGTAPIRVRYADGERERIVTFTGAAVPHKMYESDLNITGAAILRKVYVSGLNRQASREEVIELFSSYGVIEDIYLMQDDFKQSRGCGFVEFSQRAMAVAAINGLNGTYMMKGCDQPLIVRFADPKKPKNREVRSAPDPRDLLGGMTPASFHFGNSCALPYENAVVMGAPIPTPLVNLLPPPPSSVIHQLVELHGVSPHSFQIPSLYSQNLDCGSQSFDRVESQMQTALSLNNWSSVQLGVSHTASDQAPETVNEPQMVPVASVQTNGAVSSSQPASPRIARCVPVEEAPDCDWSEHICPDGHKYYYNCMTYESRWEKPEEFLLFEEQLHKQEQHLQNLPVTEVQSSPCLDICSGEESSLSQAMECQTGSSPPENCLKPMSCAEEHNHEKLTADADRVTSPAIVLQ